MSTADYSRLQLNGLQVGQPGTAPLRYGNRPRRNRKDSPDYRQPDNPCPTCGQPLTPDPPCTTTRYGRTFTTQISRCNNKRQKCPPQIIEMEITEMPRHEHPVKVQPREWVDSVNTRRADLGLSQARLAKRAGIHMSMLTKALSEHYGATEATVWAIDNALAVLDHEKQESEHYYLECHAATQHGNTIACASRCGRLAHNGADMCDECSALPLINPTKDLGEPSHTIAALQERVATLAGEQDRFWCELAEAMKRLTETESELARHGISIDGLKDAHESLTDAYTLRIGNLEHQSRVHQNTLAKMEEAYRNACSVGVLADKMANLEHLPDRLTAAEHRLSDTERQIGYAEKRITINDGEINNLAKSVEHLSQDATAHEEIIKGIEDQIVTLATAQQESFYQSRNTQQISNLTERIGDLETRPTEDNDHDNAIAFLELAVQTLTQRLSALEARDTEKFAKWVIECLAGRLG